MAARLFPILSALMVAGCAAVGGAPRPVGDSGEEVRLLAALHTPPVILACASGVTQSQPPTVLTADQARLCRDQIIIARRHAIDLNYASFEQAYFAQNNWAGFGATLAALGLGTAGAFSGAQAARALAAGSAALAGGRASYEREVLAERTALALSAAMRSERDRIAVRLVVGMRRSAAEYPLLAALSDLEAYQRAGSLLGAMSALNQAAGAEAAQAQQALANASGFAATAPSGYLQSLIDNANETERAAAVQRITEAMARLGFDRRGQTVTGYVTNERHVAEHRVLARALGWTGE